MMQIHIMHFCFLFVFDRLYFFKTALDLKKNSEDKWVPTNPTVFPIINTVH